MTRRDRPIQQGGRPRGAAKKNTGMARLLVVVSAPLLVGLAACSGAGSDYPITQPGNADAAVDSQAGSDATSDAMADAAPDAPPHGAELAVTITGAPDPVAASST